MNAAAAAAMLRAGADAPCCPKARAGIFALGVMICLHPEAGNMPPDPTARYDLIGQLTDDANVWRVAWRSDYPCAFIRPPIYSGDNAPTFGMKCVNFEQWDAIKDVLNAGLKVDGHVVPAEVKPAIRDAYEAWRKAQRGPQ
ncbi:hypothetical protein [Luteimonas qiangzhengi]|uniref:hypothetical protein n=1 Tax=Luteimonas sp. MJ146 TaxID=3129240 RepID=UPI0031BAF559